MEPFVPIGGPLPVVHNVVKLVPHFSRKAGLGPASPGHGPNIVPLDVIQVLVE